MALNIYPGENFIVRMNLKKKDGSNLILSTDLDSASVSVMQNGTAVQSLTYPSSNLRQGATTSQLELEVIQATSALFTKGDVTLDITIVAIDADFDTEGVQKKVTKMLVAKVV